MHPHLSSYVPPAKKDAEKETVRHGTYPVARGHQVHGATHALHHLAGLVCSCREKKKEKQQIKSNIQIISLSQE
jgi:hypothetical protein